VNCIGVKFDLYGWRAEVGYGYWGNKVEGRIFEFTKLWCDLWHSQLFENCIERWIKWRHGKISLCLIHYFLFRWCKSRGIKCSGHGTLTSYLIYGRAIARAVSRWLPTTAARVRSRVWSSGICGGQVALGQVFSEYFGVPCQSSFHQLLHYHPQLSSGAGTIGQKWPQYKELNPTPLAIKINLVHIVAGPSVKLLKSKHISRWISGLLSVWTWSLIWCSARPHRLECSISFLSQMTGWDITYSFVSARQRKY
jgi:hypothetical protein